MASSNQSLFLRSLAAHAPALVQELIILGDEQAVTLLRSQESFMDMAANESEDEQQRAVLVAAERLCRMLQVVPGDLLSADGVSLNKSESEAWERISARLLLVVAE